MTHTVISPLPGLTLRVGLNRAGKVNKAGVRKVRAALKGLTPGEAMLVQALHAYLWSQRVKETQLPTKPTKEDAEALLDRGPKMDFPTV